MEKAKVYFTDFRTTAYGDNLPLKLERLARTAGMNSIDFNNKFVAIKMHFGEPGNVAFLRPNYPRVIVDMIKAQGGKPFLTDCNTLYVGGRKNGLVHLDTAYTNGFSPFSTNCHVIIADGLKGTDDVEVPVNGELIKTALIGHAIMDADVFISLTHFKGHENAGFGGTLKNIGMGCGSRAGKMAQHASGKPSVDQSLCIGCGRCVKICAQDAPKVTNHKSFIDHEKCVGCGRCIAVCPVDAVTPAWDAPNDQLNMKIAEYALAVVQGRPNFHISLVMDVSPNCDCHSENDLPIVPDVGMFASFDPVALDQACYDAVNKQPVLSGSILDESTERNNPDHFIGAHPDTNGVVALEHGEKIGLGTRSYELITVK